jgi:hypothetical protein
MLYMMKTEGNNYYTFCYYIRNYQVVINLLN